MKHRFRAALPVPAAIRAWPSGLRPGRLVATADGIELLFRSPRAGEVRLLVDEQLRVQTLLAGSAPRLAERLSAQVGARLRTLPPATREAFRHVRRALHAIEGDAPLSGSLAVFRWLRDAEGPPPDTTGDETTAPLGVLALSQGDLETALTMLDRWRAEERDPTAGDALLLAFAGRGVEARASLHAARTPSAMSADAWKQVAISLHEWTAAHRISRAHTPTDDPTRLSVSMELALQAGDHPWAGRAALELLSLDATLEQQQRALLVCIQTRRAASAARWLDGLAAPPAELMLSGAEIALYRTRLDEARRWLARLGELEPDVHLRRERVAGAVLLVEGRCDEAIARLDPVLEAWPKDRQTTLLLAEAHLREGRPTEGLAMLERFNKKVTGEHPVGKLLFGLGRLPWLYAAPGFDEAPGSTLYLHRNIAADILDERPSFGPDEQEAEAAFILRAVDAFGGNRSDTLTLLDGEELRAATHVQDPRVHIVGAQHRVLTEPVEAVRERLRTLALERADVPYPATYEAEIDLWRGDYDRACAAFEDIYTRTGTRWGYVGWGAALAMRGDAERAIEVLDEGARRVSGEIAGEATPAYRGEALLQLGRLDEAISELRRATRLRPTRLGAWATLAIALARRGDDDAVAVRDHFLDETPVLAWEAQKSIGLCPRWPVPPAHRWTVLETARAQMRGSRSSYLLTFFDHDGRWRVREIAGHRDRATRAALKTRWGVLTSALESFLGRHHGAASRGQRRAGGDAPPD